MKNAIKRMLARDVSVVLGFVVFVWVTMCFIMSSILTAVGSSQTRTLIIATGVAALFFATLSLLVLLFHLRKNRQDIYAEEILHSRANTDATPCDIPVEEPLHPKLKSKTLSHNAFVNVFDIVFIMALCFVTLLATMLLRGKAVNGANIYSLGIGSAVLTVVGFTVYIVTVIKKSDRELKMMVDELYSEEEPSSE